MGTLTVWKFETTTGADDAERALLRLSEEGVIKVHDAAMVTWEVGKKKPKTRQLSPTAAGGALGGSFWGLLFGMIFFVPLIGAAIGAATGALAGSLTDVGIDDDFIKRVREQDTPGTSALFLLSSDAVIARMRDTFAEGEKPELIYTTLSNDQEDALREVFAE
jgi:uncharacterized membrane protein